MGEESMQREQHASRVDEALERVRALVEQCRKDPSSPELPEDLANAVADVSGAVEEDARAIIGSARREAWEVLTAARGELAMLAFEIRAKRNLLENGGVLSEDERVSAVPPWRQFVTDLSVQSALAFRRILHAVDGSSRAAWQAAGARVAGPRGLPGVVLERWRSVSGPAAITIAAAVPVLVFATVMWFKATPPAETPAEAPQPSLGTGGVATVDSHDPEPRGETSDPISNPGRSEKTTPAPRPGPAAAVTTPGPAPARIASAPRQAASDSAQATAPPVLNTAPPPGPAPVASAAPVANPAPGSNTPPVLNTAPVSNTAPALDTARVSISAPLSNPIPPVSEPAPTTPPPPASTRDMLLSRDGEWFDAHYRGDRTALLQLSLPAFEFVDERPPGERPVVQSAAPVRALRDVRVDEFGDSALLTGRMTEQIPDGGREYESLLSEVWVRHEGQWRLISVRLASPKTIGSASGR